MKKSVFGSMLAVALLIGIGSAWSQTATTTRDPLRQLKNALQNAGAPALTTSQETQLTALLTSFRTANRPTAPDATVQSARRDYQDAVVAGDAAAASKNAAILLTNMADQAAARMKAQTDFTIAAINILRTNGDQLSILAKQVGNAGVVRLVDSLIGGGPGVGFGRGMGAGQGAMGRGPMGQAPMGAGRRQR
jgi:hypothetical protein